MVGDGGVKWLKRIKSWEAKPEDLNSIAETTLCPPEAPSLIPETLSSDLYMHCMVHVSYK